jgi:ATP-dependent Clp protease protease subunit
MGAGHRGGGLHAEEGILFLGEVIDPDSAQELVDDLIAIALMPPWEKPDDVTVLINSPGGCLHSTMKIVDTIRQMPYPVATCISGQAASGALLVAMSGAKGRRVATDSSLLMSHQFATNSGGKYHELVADRAMQELSHEIIEKRYKQFTGRSTAYIRKHLLPAHDVYLTAAQAKEHGLVDEVLLID